MSMVKFIFLQILLTHLLSFKCNAVSVKVTKVHCRNLDENYTNITHCWTKPIKRDITETTVRVLLLQPPLRNSVVKIKLMKKSNNYNMFYPEQTVDGCQFMAQHKRFPFIKQLFATIEPYTNINHTCPYEGVIIIDRFRLDSKKMEWMPLQDGVYAFFTTWLVSGKPRVEINIYFQTI